MRGSERVMNKVSTGRADRRPEPSGGAETQTNRGTLHRENAARAGIARETETNLRFPRPMPEAVPPPPSAVAEKASQD